MTDADPQPARTDDGRSRDRERPPAPEPLPHPVVDNHCHLDIADGPDGAWLATGEALAGPPRSGSPGSCRSAATCPARAGPSRPRTRTTRSSPASRCTPTRRRGSPRRARSTRRSPRSRRSRTDPRVRAVGETGLDYFRTGEDGRAAQQRSFRRHVELAKRLDRTLVIHDRDAHDDVLRILDEEGAPDRWVMHCFSGDAEFARALPRPRCVPVVRRHRHVQERRAAARGAAGRPAGPDPGRDRRAVPDADAVPRPAQRVVPGAADDAVDGRDPRRRPRGALPAVDANTDRAFGGTWG